MSFVRLLVMPAVILMFLPALQTARAAEKHKVYSDATVRMGSKEKPRAQSIQTAGTMEQCERAWRAVLTGEGYAIATATESGIIGPAEKKTAPAEFVVVKITLAPAKEGVTSFLSIHKEAIEEGRRARYQLIDRAFAGIFAGLTDRFKARATALSLFGTDDCDVLLGLAEKAVQERDIEKLSPLMGILSTIATTQPQRQRLDALRPEHQAMLKTDYQRMNLERLAILEKLAEKGEYGPCYKELRLMLRRRETLAPDVASRCDALFAQVLARLKEKGEPLVVIETEVVRDSNGKASLKYFLANVSDRDIARFEMKIRWLDDSRIPAAEPGGPATGLDFRGNYSIPAGADYFNSVDLGPLPEGAKIAVTLVQVEFAGGGMWTR